MNANEEKDAERLMHDPDRQESHCSDCDNIDAPSDDTLRTMRELRAALLKKTVDKPDIDREWVKVADRLGFNRTTNGSGSSPVRPRRGLWIASGIAIGVAASFLVMLLVKAFIPSLQHAPNDAVLLYSALAEREKVEMAVVAEETDSDESQGLSGTNVKPRLAKKETSTQTIDDGIEVIDMRQAVASADMEERIIRTPIGKEIRIILADNTRVLLGSESSLRFPVRFTSDMRRVWLEGEAYFEVAKESQRRFDVVSQSYVTTALGTEFDVKAYPRADVQISLIEGSVRVEDTVTNGYVVLKAGQDVKCVGGKLVVSEIDTKVYKYWKDGYFYYSDTPLVDMLIELGRWYNVNIELNSRSLMSYRMHFVAKRDEKMSEIADRLGRIGSFKVNFDGSALKISE